MLTIAVLKESLESERRVALVPESVKRLVKLEARVLVEPGAGSAAGFTREEYEEAGAAIAQREVLLGEASILARVKWDRIEPAAPGAICIGFFNPFGNIHYVQELASGGVTALSMELVPRISRAQRMDALSAMSSAAGYKAVILAADRLDKFFPLMMTAAGTISPARILVIGAGVAGLQAIATAKRLGARVKAFDTRPVVKEQVESLGAEFVPLEVTEHAETSGGYAVEMSEDFYRHEQQAIAHHIGDCDAVITTAQVFGKRAPLLITEEMVRTMRRGAVIVDLAAEQGGNCELTIAGRTVDRDGVLIIGETDLPGSLAHHTSEMYSRNVTALVQELVSDGEVRLDLDDELIRSCLLTHEGAIRNQHVIDLLGREAEGGS